MLNVWTVCVGDKYRDIDVHIVKYMCERHIEQPHRFMCLSDRQIEGVTCFIPDDIWPGWWSKLLLFRYATGQVLYMDLDVVVMANLDQLLSERLSMPSNWAQSGHGGCQSSVMSWNADVWPCSILAEMFRPEDLTSPCNGNYGYYHGLWGDQEYITSHLGNPGNFIVEMEGIYSYKYHCQNHVPNDAAVICFHGKPKPDEVNSQWIKKARSFT
jgi:hypothetical protein